MGKQKYPVLKHSEVIDIIRALGFVFKRQTASHAHYERTPDSKIPERKLVTVGAYSEFDDDLIKSMVRQSGFSREDFYGATKKTAKKI